MEAFRARPDWARRLNYFGAAAGDPRLVVPLEPIEMLQQTRAFTGLHDVGGVAWEETFERRIRSIDTDSQANLLGRLLCRAEALRVLQTRLRLCAEWTARPEILDEPIERPVFVVGAPRTGTTILLELLALDPELRAPIAWEAHHPLPHAGASDQTAARAVAEAEQELWADIQPELMALHELRSDLPCECVHFFALDFGSPYWSMHYSTPSFDEWAATQEDLVPRTYRDHRKFLQTLQHGNSARRWLLKSPAHMATMHQLIAEYPDAVIVHTHRDPLKFVGSTASTTAMLSWLRSDQVDRLAQGQVALAGFGFLLDFVRTSRADGSLPDHQFIDSHYLDLMADPVAALRRVYDGAGLDWPSGHDDRVLRYLRDKPKGKFGRHEYTLEEFGLDAASVRSTFAGYVEHYGVREEAPG